jgi:hypothetical protein
MDFCFGEMSNSCISIMPYDSYNMIYLPDFLLNRISVIKLANWVKEIKGEMRSINSIIIPRDISVSDIYSTYYHFIE